MYRQILERIQALIRQRTYNPASDRRAAVFFGAVGGRADSLVVASGTINGGGFN